VRRIWIAVLVGLVLVTLAVTSNVQPGQVLWLYAFVQLLTIGLITFATSSLVCS
jgi:hypothetical protein